MDDILVFKRLSIDEVPDICQHLAGMVVDGIIGCPGQVWSDDDIVELRNEGMIGCDGFDIEHINGCACYNVVPKCFYQCSFIDEHAARRVYEIRTLLHVLQDGFIDEVEVFWDVFAMDGHDIGFFG